MFEAHLILRCFISFINTPFYQNICLVTDMEKPQSEIALQFCLRKADIIPRGQDIEV